MTRRLVQGVLCAGALTWWGFNTRTGERIEGQRSNLVVTAGMNLLRDLLYGDVVAGVTHFAVGTSGTAPAAGHTTLIAEVFREAVTSKTKATTKLTVQHFLASGSANGNTLREAALFNAASAGVMYSRALILPEIVKTSSVSFTFQWELTWSA